MSRKEWILFIIAIVLGIVFLVGIILTPVILAHSGDSEDANKSENTSEKPNENTNKTLAIEEVKEEAKESALGLYSQNLVLVNNEKFTITRLLILFSIILKDPRYLK